MKTLNIDFEVIQEILTNCTNLKELTIGGEISGQALAYLGNNLPLRIEKFDLSNNIVNDKFINAIVTKYKNLKALDLSNMADVTDDHLTAIIEHLKNSLEELDLSYTTGGFTLEKLLELKSMPKLKVFQCYHLKEDEIKTLENDLPNLIKPIKGLHMGLSLHGNPKDGFWEIQAKQLKIFKQHLSLTEILNR